MLLLTLVPIGLLAVLVATVTVTVAKGVLDDYADARNRMALATLALAVEPVLANPTQTQQVITQVAHTDALTTIWLVSPAGEVIASSDLSSIGRPYAPGGDRSTPAKPHGEVSELTLATSGMRLASHSDGRVVREIATVIGFGAVVALGVGALITTWSVSRLARGLATPVAEAATAASAMADGNFMPAQQLPPSSVREGEQLRAALRHTAQRLHELTAGLENQVVTRTAQLELATGQALAAHALAEEASRSKSLFLANMSHELRTPLNAIIGYAEMIAEDVTGPESVPRDLGRINQAARHLLALINDILDYTKLEAGRMRVHRESFTIRQVVDQAVIAINPLLAGQRNRLSVTVDDQPTEAHGDALKLRQILINLLGNAAKFTSDGEIRLVVRVDSTAGNQQLVISVADTGIGIDDQQRGQLFKPFATSEAQRRHGGTGLGLAICAHYCQLMGGHISCHSVKNHGATFTIRIPLGASAGSARQSAIQHETRSA